MNAQLALFVPDAHPPIPDYVYMGDRLTAPELVGMPVYAVRRADGRCQRGKNGNMLLETVDGRRFVGLARQLAKRRQEAQS